MVPWLRGTTWFQRITLALLAAALVLWLYTLATNDESAFGLVVFAGVLAFFAFRKQLLWRVRNRLLLTFFLFGVVPLVLISVLAQLTTMLALGQFATERVRQGLEARIASVQTITRDIALAASRNASPELLDEIRIREPRLQAIVQTGATLALPQGSTQRFSSAPAWLAADFRGLFADGPNYFIGAKVTEGNASAFTYLPIDDEILATIAPGVVALAGIYSDEVNTNVNFNASGSRVAVETGGIRKEVTFDSFPPKGSWDVSIATIVPWELQTATNPEEDVVIPVFSRPSRLLAGLVTGRFARVIVSVLVIVAGFFLFVELVSLVSSLHLTRTITRSVHDLYQGTLRVAAGDFAHDIPVRGHHQLGDLAASFNSMTAQIRHYIGEMRKKEKLESELEIARQVQSRLFPRTIPELKTLEMSGVCLPGRFVSGDYYDFVRLDDRYTAIALGDVSGKGVSAALLMASIQSSLHAQLKFSGPALDPSLSTATLMALISQQLYESTPAEKYATFFCSVYDDETGMLRYTNCGHLKPILVRGGQASTLEGDGMVVGLLPKVTYEQHEIQLQSGDLLAIFSDGIPEAENAASQEFSETRLAELLTQHATEPLEKIIQLVTESVRAWIHDPDTQDDTTIVLLRKR